MTNRLFRFVAIEFGQDNKSGERKICPGETDCDDFQSAAGATRVAKENNACAGCPFFPTKVNREKTLALESRLDSMVDRIVGLFWELKTGYRPKESCITRIEYLGLVFITEQWSRRERVLQIENVELAKALMKRSIF